MNVNIEIGDPITKTTRRNVYQLDITFMHGDADAYTNETHFFPAIQEQRLKHYLAIDRYISEKYDDSDHLQRYALEYLESIGMPEAERKQLASDFADAFREGDVTCDGCRNASISGMDVTWWNEDGIQHEVDISFD